MKTTAGQLGRVTAFLKQHGVDDLGLSVRILMANGDIDIKHGLVRYRDHEITNRYTYRGMWVGTHENYSGPEDPCCFSHILSGVLDEIDEWHLENEQ